MLRAPNTATANAENAPTTRAVVDRYLPVDQLGSTDDCGFAPFCDDTSTTREMAFAKIRARVLGTAMATAILGGTR